MSILNLTPTELRHAADLKERIAGLESQLAGIIYVGGKTNKPAHAPQLAKPAKRKMSPAHKAKIRAAQKLRWAKVNGTKAKPVAKKARRKMSAAGRAAIAAAARVRWVKAKAAGKTSL